MGIPEMATDRTRVVVYVEDDLKRAAETLAAADDRPLSSWIRKLIKDAVDAAGLDLSELAIEGDRGDH